MIGYFWPSKSLHVCFEWIIAHNFYFRLNADVSNHRFCFLLFLAWIQRLFLPFSQNFSPPLDRFWCDDLPLGQDFQSLGRILLITKNEALSYGKRPLHIFEQLSLVTPQIVFVLKTRLKVTLAKKEAHKILAKGFSFCVSKQYNTELLLCFLHVNKIGKYLLSEFENLFVGLILWP